MSTEMKENTILREGEEEIMKNDFEAVLDRVENEIKEAVQEIKKMRPLKDVLKEIEEGRKQNTNSKSPKP